MAFQSSATAVAHSNIALIKYWGKQPKTGNFPAVPSLSLTLDALHTRTQATFDSSLHQDEFYLDGTRVRGPQLARVSQLLDSVRNNASLQLRARIDSTNNFPTAAGLASSASGFAALALAASAAARLNWTLGDVSALARASSASAARSAFGGWVTLELNAPSARPLQVVQNHDWVLLIAITEKGPKSIGSTEAMNHCAATSPVYEKWLEQSPMLFEQACRALHAGDIGALGRAMEVSTWLMHATMLAARPAIIYFAPASLQIIKVLQRHREIGVPAYFTTDAGPHVKVLTQACHANEVGSWISDLPGVNRLLTCRAGPDAFVESSMSQGDTE